MPKKAKIPNELVKKKEKFVADIKHRTAGLDEFYEKAIAFADNTKFNELKCNHSWWIENNIIKTIPYFEEKKAHKIAIDETDMEETLKYLVDVTNVLNNQTRYQPTVLTFCRLLGISTSTFNNWSNENNERGETARLIQDYFRSMLAQGLATGELNPLSGMFIGKSTLGMRENDAPQMNFNFINTDMSVEDIMAEFSKNRK